MQSSFLCRLRSIATLRDHFVLYWYLNYQQIRNVWDMLCENSWTSYKEHWNTPWQAIQTQQEEDCGIGHMTSSVIDELIAQTAATVASYWVFMSLIWGYYLKDVNRTAKKSLIKRNLTALLINIGFQSVFSLTCCSIFHRYHCVISNFCCLSGFCLLFIFAFSAQRVFAQ